MRLFSAFDQQYLFSPMIHEQMDICIEMMTYSHTLTRSDFIRLVGCLKRVILLSLSLCSFVCFPAVDYLAWVNDVPI